jgi:hypothetical protein
VSKYCSNSNLKQFISILPDSCSIQENLTKLKSKIKTIDELVLKKNENTKQKTLKTSTTIRNESNKKNVEASFLKQEIRKILYYIDVLESKIISKKINLILSYFNSIKNLIHKPYQEILSKLSNNPSTAESKKMIDSEFEVFKKSEDAYNTIKTSEILLKTANLKSELEFIESKCSDLIECIKQFMVGQYSSFFFKSEDSTRKWNSTLKNLIQLSIFELLSNCTNEFLFIFFCFLLFKNIH